MSEMWLPSWWNEGTRNQKAKELLSWRGCCYSYYQEMSIFPAKTSTHEDHCFIMKEGNMFLCSHKDCTSVGATFFCLQGMRLLQL